MGNKIDQAKQNFNDTTSASNWEDGVKAFSVDPNVDELSDSFGQGVDNLINSGANIVSAGATLGKNVAGYFQHVNNMDDPEQWERLGDTAGAASINYAQQKIERIRTAWNTPATISIGSLIDEVSPYATDIKAAGKALLSNLNRFVGYLSGTAYTGDTKEFYFNLLIGDYVEYMAKDPATMEALGDLEAIKAIASVIGTVSNGIDILQEILKICEPIAPTLHVASLVASSWINPLAAGEASHTLADIGYQLLFDVYRLNMKYLRNFIYNIEFQVPSLLVGALNSLSVRDAVAKYSYDGSYTMLKDITDEDGKVLEEGRKANEGDEFWHKMAGSLFDDSFYETSPMTNSWYVGIQQGLSNFQQSAIGLGPAKQAIDRANRGGSDLKSLSKKLLGSVAKSVLNQISINARKAANVTELKGTDFISYRSMKAFFNNAGKSTATNKPSGNTQMMTDSPVKDERDVQRISGLLSDALD